MPGTKFSFFEKKVPGSGTRFSIRKGDVSFGKIEVDAETETKDPGK